MHKFIIDSENVLYKNYIIRTTCNHISLVSYENLLPEVSKNIQSIYETNCAPCSGNWAGGGWYAGGLCCSNFGQKIDDLKSNITSYEKLIDNIQKHNSSPMDEFWFFVCLVHFTDPANHTSISDNYWNYRWIKTRHLEIMFKHNKIKDGMKRFYEEGKEKNYILKVDLEESKCLLNKDILFKLFLKSLAHIEYSFEKYDQEQFALLNAKPHVVEIENREFLCYNNKIMFSENNINYFTQFNDLKAITSLPVEQREKALFEQFTNNKKEIANNDQLIDNLPYKNLTGQITAFYLNSLLKNDNALEFPNDELEKEMLRELKAKKYMEWSISYIKGKGMNSFTKELEKDIEAITNDDFYAELEKYAESIKTEHTAINHIKDKAKLLKKQTGMSLMKAQDEIVKGIFEQNSLAKLYVQIKEDIINTIKKNTKFLYSKEKDENLVLYGKNHIGFYALKDINDIRYHMAFFNGEKVIDRIKEHASVISWKELDIEKYKAANQQIHTNKDGIFQNANQPQFVLINNLLDIDDLVMNQVLMQGRIFNIHLIFNFKDDAEILKLLKNEVFKNNLHDISYSREMYEMLYGSLEANKVAVKTVMKTGSQLEHFV